MISGHIFVVLGKELRVLECYDGAVCSLQHRGSIADTAYASTGSFTNDVVANFHATHHEGNAIVDVLQDVFRCKTQTR